MKQPKETRKIDDSRYCKHHRLVEHPIHDYFIFKDNEDKATMNLIAVEVGIHHVDIVSCNTSEQKVSSNEACCSKVETHGMIEECMLALTFIDDNLLLNSKSHNMPLFMVGYAHERKLNTPPIQLSMNDTSLTALFHVINAKTLYNMLLDHPWLYGVVKKVLADDKLFTRVESHFADTKYYFEKDHVAKKTSKDVLIQKLTRFFLKRIQPARMPPLEKLPLEATRKQTDGLNTTQSVLKRKRHALPNAKVGLGFIPRNFILHSNGESVASSYHIESCTNCINGRNIEENRQKNGQVRACMNLENIECIEEVVMTHHTTFNEDIIEEYTEAASPELEEGVKATVGVEIEQVKIDVILKIPKPRNIHELKSLQGKLAYLRRFISNLVGRCQLFSHVMKKSVPFKWDEVCSNAFSSIKAYLMKPPVLVVLVLGCQLVLYIAARECSIGVQLVQENNNGKENALYYLSRMMTPNELKHSSIQKICLALISTIQKPVLFDKLARWYLQLQQFEIVYVSQNIVKGQVLANFLADLPIPAEWELSDDLLDEDVLVIKVTLPWKMYFDEVSCRKEVGAGVIFIKSNDYKLVVNQLLGKYEVKKPGLLPYFNHAKKLIGWLGDVEIKHVLRAENKQVDALMKLTSLLTMPKKEARIPTCRSWIAPPIFENEDYEKEENHIVEVFKVKKKDWCQSLIYYLKYEKLPDDPWHRTDIQRQAARFIYYKGVLYRCSFGEVFL
ncbi:hypothetical protein CDL12_06762 [Handroanthus impetiginosus]|uniref:Reverse transcriptase/retrotransposon-derived protein RNase H-like domain-containing protein n=1 Tax=Handroanthus impetiginosus TaxID=429701 RepID=A0A2G9HSP5_9LAMI|nr:hypothetical protein CDL12_06762 [Handroanthus impetiginosus]